MSLNSFDIIETELMSQVSIKSNELEKFNIYSKEGMR